MDVTKIFKLLKCLGTKRVVLTKYFGKISNEAPALEVFWLCFITLNVDPLFYFTRLFDIFSDEICLNCSEINFNMDRSSDFDKKRL